MTRRSLGFLLALAFGILGLAVMPGTMPVAQAVTGTPPVTTPDTLTVLQGNGASVAPVTNDHDADNDVLAICRLGTEHYRGLDTDVFGYDFEVFAKPSAKPGTYTFTYYACDFSYLTVGTITVTVEKLPEIKVTKISGRPGTLRVTNPSDLKVKFLYGSFKEDRPDGRLTLKRNSSAVISVHRSRIDWVATNRKGDIFLGSGHVDGIKVGPAAGRQLGHAPLAPRLVEAWRAA